MNWTKYLPTGQSARTHKSGIKCTALNHAPANELISVGSPPAPWGRGQGDTKCLEVLPTVANDTLSPAMMLSVQNPRTAVVAALLVGGQVRDPHPPWCSTGHATSSSRVSGREFEGRNRIDWHLGSG